MTRRIVSLHPQAIAEGREARLWYRLRSQVVEERYRLALRAAIAAIRDSPERWPADEEGFRSRRVVGFPYRLIYWTDGTSILILAIAHSKRRPGYWKQRAARRGVERSAP